MSITNYTGTYQNYLGYLGAKKCCELRGLGPTGPRGATGPPGPVGIGLRGQNGVTGAMGEQGPAGTMGLYCCYGTNTYTDSTVTSTDPFIIYMQGNTLLPDVTYAVNISIHIYGDNDIGNPRITFNLSNDPETGGSPFYPQLFSNADQDEYYLSSAGSTSSPYIYSGSLTDYVYYNPTSTLQSPIINVYISPTDTTNRFKIKLVATIYPVSS
jgi:hypothetical protein